MIYVPDFDADSCAIFYSSDVIRVYANPQDDTSVDYTDYYFNSHYLSSSSSEYINDVSELNCLPSLTSNFYYRTDICEILIIAFIFIFTNWFLVSKLWKAITKGRRTI